MEHVCSVLEHDTVPPKKYTQSLVCPEGCKMYRMADYANDEKNSTLSMFNLGQDGRTLSINSNSSYNKVYSSVKVCLSKHYFNLDHIIRIKKNDVISLNLLLITVCYG